MATIHALLTAGLIGSAVLCGVLATRLLLIFRKLGPVGIPPFQYNDSTLRDFELLSAAGGLLLFTSFITVVAGFYEFAALQTAVRVPATLFTLILLLLLHRWKRRF